MQIGTLAVRFGQVELSLKYLSEQFCSFFCFLNTGIPEIILLF